MIDLAQRRESRAVPLLMRQLDTPDSMAAGYVARALASIGEPAIAPLIGALGSGSSALRENAAYALGEIGDPQALEPLKNALADPEERVRQSAARALVGVRSPRAVETLLGLLNGSDLDLAYGAALGLGRDRSRGWLGEGHDGNTFTPMMTHDHALRET